MFKMSVCFRTKIRKKKYKTVNWMWKIPKRVKHK